MHCIMWQFHTIMFDAHIISIFFSSYSQTHTLFMLVHMVNSLIQNMCSTSRPWDTRQNNTVAKAQIIPKAQNIPKAQATF